MNTLNLNNLDNEIKELNDLLKNGSDLACVLIGTSFLYVCLFEILRFTLRKGETSKRILNHNSGFLGSFRNRMDMCYCMNLVNKKMFQI